MRRLAHMVRKEFLQLLRDRKMLPIVFIAPVLQLILLGYAANLDVTHLPMAVIDMDNSAPSRELVRTFVSSDYFDGVLYGAVPEDGGRALADGTVSVVLTIPEGFGSAFVGSRGAAAHGDEGGVPEERATMVQVLIDGSNSTVGTAAGAYVNAILGAFQEKLVNPHGTGGRGGIDIRSQVLFNPSMETKNFMIPGIFALLLMLVTMVLSSLAIVKEKELGTLEQLNVTPVTPLQMVAGKLLPFVIIGLVDIVLVFIVSRVVFAVPFRGSFTLLFAASFLFLGSTLGLGLFISTIADTQQQAMLTASFFVMIPMFFLSGFAFPLESMPRVMQYLSYFFPLRYYLIILRAIFLKGAGAAELWDQLVMLTGFGVAIFAAAALRFRKRSG
ncbi:MAG: ABC transporter permease [Alkalispirochaeta sp.]